MSIEIRGQRSTIDGYEQLYLRAVREPHPCGPAVIGQAWVRLDTRELIYITVEPAYRRMGIGTQLLLRASRKIVHLSHAPSTGFSGLWVAPATRSPEFAAWRASLPPEMQRTHPAASDAVIPKVVGFIEGTTAGGLS